MDFNWDSSRLVTGSADGTMLIVDLQNEKSNITVIILAILVLLTIMLMLTNENRHIEL
jgi:hypothetical protein